MATLCKAVLYDHQPDLWWGQLAVARCKSVCSQVHQWCHWSACVIVSWLETQAKGSWKQRFGSKCWHGSNVQTTFYISQPVTLKAAGGVLSANAAMQHLNVVCTTNCSEWWLLPKLSINVLTCLLRHTSRLMRQVCSFCKIPQRLLQIDSNFGTTFSPHAAQQKLHKQAPDVLHLHCCIELGYCWKLCSLEDWSKTAFLLCVNHEILALQIYMHRSKIRSTSP